jgi:hypothetical protein
MKYYVITGIGRDCFEDDWDELVGEVITPRKYLDMPFYEYYDGKYRGGCKVITGPKAGSMLYFAEVAAMECV